MHRGRRVLSVLLALVMAAGLLGAASPTAFAAGESVPYAEDRGLSFVTDTEFQIPMFFYQTKDGEYLPNTESCIIEPIRDADYTITELSLSEPDANGMVELTLSYTIDGIACHMNDGAADKFGGRYKSFSFFDYYSGYTFTGTKYFSNSGKDSVETVLTYNGEEMSVTRDTAWDTELEWSPWSYNKYSQWQNELNMKAIFIVSFKFPAEYDGLCLMINKNGITEYSEAWEDEEEKANASMPLHEWMGDKTTKDDYYFLRVSELLAQQA